MFDREKYIDKCLIDLSEASARLKISPFSCRNEDKNSSELTKICWYCKKEKSLFDFYLNKAKKDCLDDACKSCKKIMREKIKNNFYLLNEDLPEKLCRGCNRVLESKCFSKSKLNSTGLQSRCKECNKKYIEEKKLEKEKLKLLKTK